MACRDAYKNQTKIINQMTEETRSEKASVPEVKSVDRLLFGVDSKVQSDDILQNNLTEFEWVRRNKIYPSFWGRNLAGENHLTREEIDFLHSKGCRIAALYNTSDTKETEQQGKITAKKIYELALELSIPQGTAVFLEIGEREKATTAYMRGFAAALISNGYTPAFMANTDSEFDFDREYSRGMQTDKDIFSKCLIWAVAPSLEEYERVTTTHLIHPDNWVPYAPSGITRNDIAVWQYGKNCHPIYNDAGVETTFNVNLVRNEQVIIEKMF